MALLAEDRGNADLRQARETIAYGFVEPALLHDVGEQCLRRDVLVGDPVQHGPQHEIGRDQGLLGIGSGGQAEIGRRPLPVVHGIAIALPDHAAGDAPQQDDVESGNDEDSASARAPEWALLAAPGEPRLQQGI